MPNNYRAVWAKEKKRKEKKVLAETQANLAVIVGRAEKSIVSLFSCSSCTVGSRGGPEEL